MWKVEQQKIDSKNHCSTEKQKENKRTSKKKQSDQRFVKVLFKKWR